MSSSPRPTTPRSGTSAGATGTAPRGGDWGGIVFRNYDEATNSAQFPVDGTLQGPNGQPAVSGASDVESFLNFAEVRYAGGAVPATNGIRYDAVTLFNSRPTLTNDTIVHPQRQHRGGPGGDLGRPRLVPRGRHRPRPADPADDRGQLQPQRHLGPSQPRHRTDRRGRADRRDHLSRQPHDPGRQYATSPSTTPLPYILTSQLLIGEAAAGRHRRPDELRQQPALHPARRDRQVGSGAGISVVNNDASINIGSRTYINQFDANPNFSRPPRPASRPRPRATRGSCSPRSTTTTPRRP